MILCYNFDSRPGGGDSISIYGLCLLLFTFYDFNASNKILSNEVCVKSFLKILVVLLNPQKVGVNFMITEIWIERKNSIQNLQVINF